MDPRFCLEKDNVLAVTRPKRAPGSCVVYVFLWQRQEDPSLVMKNR